MAEILRTARRAFLAERTISEWHAEAKCFFRRVSAIPRPPAPLFSPFFSGKTEKNGPPEAHRAIPAQKRYGQRSGGGGAAYRTVLSAHTKHAAGSIPRHSGAEKTSAEAEKIGREGQNLHNLQKSTLDNDRKIRMIILSHNRSTGRRGKNRPV